MVRDRIGVVGLGMPGGLGVPDGTVARASTGAAIRGYDPGQPHRGVGTAAGAARCRVVFRCGPTPRLPATGHRP